MKTLDGNFSIERFLSFLSRLRTTLEVYTKPYMGEELADNLQAAFPQETIALREQTIQQAIGFLQQLRQGKRRSL